MNLNNFGKKNLLFLNCTKTKLFESFTITFKHFVTIKNVETR